MEIQQKHIPPVKVEVARQDNTYVHNPIYIFMEQKVKYERKEAERKEAEQRKLAEEKQKAYKQDAKNNIIRVMNNDSDIPKNLNKELIANYIVNYSFEEKIDPIIISSIAQQETHFNQGLSGDNGRGVMQITEITADDIFERPELYGDNVKSIIKKYKTSEKLLEALKKDVKLNIQVGTLVFKAKLKIAKGDIHKALVLYNGSKRKEQYAKEVENRIRAARKLEITDGKKINILM